MASLVWQLQDGVWRTTVGGQTYGFTEADKVQVETRWEALVHVFAQLFEHRLAALKPSPWSVEKTAELAALVALEVTRHSLQTGQAPDLAWREIGAPMVRRLVRDFAACVLGQRHPQWLLAVATVMGTTEVTEKAALAAERAMAEWRLSTCL